MIMIQLYPTHITQSIEQDHNSIRHKLVRPVRRRKHSSMQPSNHQQSGFDQIPPPYKKHQAESTCVEDCVKPHATCTSNLNRDVAKELDLHGQPNRIADELGNSPAATSSHRSFSNSSSELFSDSDKEHTIELSSVEHCMPRAYIRVCLAYRLTSQAQVSPAVQQLNKFIRETVNAKPYLAGFIVPQDKRISTGPVEVRFTNTDYEEYPDVEVCDLLNEDGGLVEYDEMDAQGFPPSSLNPEKVAKLPASMADEKRAPVFRARANIAKGGIVVSFYLHHCISDGTGLGLLITGNVNGGSFTFDRYIKDTSTSTPSLGRRLSEFANMKTILRKQLSWSDPNQISPLRDLSCNRLDINNGIRPSNLPGRGCVVTFPDEAVDELRSLLLTHLSMGHLSKHDALQALIWRCMSRARLPAIKQDPSITTSKLLIPVNIRGRIKPPLPDSYFGAAVDFATAQFELGLLVNHDIATLAQAAQFIHNAVSSVDEPCIRQAIALARSSDPNIDVRDLLASNMNRVFGADMYITSWERLELYSATLDMGLGMPEWVRKPWSRDPGSCIILPRNPRKAQFEVVVQMTTHDMTRLLEDQEFRKYVTKVID